MSGFKERLIVAMGRTLIKMLLVFLAIALCAGLFAGGFWLLINGYVRTFWSILLILILLVFSVLEATNKNSSPQ